MWNINIFIVLGFLSSHVLSQGNIRVLPTNFDRRITNDFVRNTLALNANPTQCKRPCIAGQNRLCYMMFDIEHYQAMGAACRNCSGGRIQDCFLPQCITATGIEKGIMTINRLLPGPLIEVCQGDLLVIDVMNNLHSDTTSIHWHGLLQRGTPYADGVPHLTQCPILPMTSFRYTFWADDVGTYFYHSHSGMQKFLGIYGGFITRAPLIVEGYPPNLYDVDDRVIILNDWSNEASEMFMVGLPTRLPGPEPQAILINGKGRYLNPETNRLTNVPYETIFVEAGRSYRFRIISAISMVCPIEIQIQGHRMNIIGVDGSPVNSRFVDTIVMTSGERFDVVIQANRPVGLYWIFTRLSGVCASMNIVQSAVLSYISTSGTQTPTTPQGPYPRGVVINDPDVGCGVNANNLCIVNLTSSRVQSLSNAIPDQRFYMTFGNRDLDPNTHFLNGRLDAFWNTRENILLLGTMNGISFVSPPSPLLSQPNTIPFVELCNFDSLPNRCINATTCRCTHVVRARLNTIVEFYLIDESPEVIPIVHPIHFHGLKFAVMQQGIIQSTGSLTVPFVRNLRAQGQLPPLVSSPPLKDTVMVHSHGYVVMRFLADNPGMWLVHCHVDDHMLFGMVFVLIIEGETPLPPPGYPQCGNFPPDI